jgi:prephenate dehydrogenase
VALCLPASQVRETLEWIAPDLAEGAMVLDTSPVKSGTMDWVKKNLPAGRHYIGLVPAVNPEAMHDLRLGPEAARADLFTNGTVLIDAPHGVPEDAVRLAMDFVRLLGAQPLLADAAESDGLMTTVHLLPQLASAALLTATLDQPGWQEARKMAGRAYAIATSGVVYQDELDSLRMQAMQNRPVTVHALDVLILALRGLRDDIEKGDDGAVAGRLEAALEGRQRWMHERLSATWVDRSRDNPIEMPSFMERLLGGAFWKKHGK